MKNSTTVGGLAWKNRLGLLLGLALRHDTRTRAVKLAAVVGTVLFIINQWEACLGLVPVQWLKGMLTYLVPYMVSTYTSTMKDYEALAGGRQRG
jgi:hypothetical protein